VDRILEDTVGECGRPKIGWQIDPFGHSREHASLSKQFGFEGLVVGRIDYRDKKRRKAEKKLDFVWKSSDSLGIFQKKIVSCITSDLENSQIFTTMFPALYVSEPGFQFDTVRGNKITKRNLNYKVRHI
jgi:lysosomal alpha-mannosidase